MGYTNAEAFKRECDLFTKMLIPDEVVLFQKKMVLEALRRLTSKTPVDTGRAKGNWQTSIGAPIREAVDVLDTVSYTHLRAHET